MSATATAAIDSAPTTTRAARSKLGALAGVAFAVCFFMGTATLEIPKNASDQELVAWWSESANQTTAVVSMYLFVLAGLSFLVFLVQLRSRLHTADSEPGELTLVVVAGAVFVAMLFVAAAARGWIGFAVKSPMLGEPLPGPDTLRYLPVVGYAITSTGGLLAAALAMATTSWWIVKTGVFGRWLAVVGAIAAGVVVVTSALLAGGLGIPAVIAWALATSVALWRGKTT